MAWARQAAVGDRVAFGRLYARYANVVHGVVLATAGPERMDDLSQEVFLKALRRIEDLKEPRHVGSWLRTIAKNVARDALRAARTKEPLPDEVAAPQRPEKEAREVMETVQMLPPAYRETLVLRLVEGMTGPEIADRTGLTPGSVRVNLCRGMKLLTQRLQERGWL
ncbi:MAG: RNA polymerase subunit sigma-24 [Planctomycetes bacterium]|nr:RNA polymerase subunit sigma-24 [Planctomycetota bacterium]